MGLFTKLFGGTRAVRDNGYFKTLTAYAPVFTTWDGQLYESELVRAAIDAKARHISKLNVVVEGSGRPQLTTKLKHAPNAWQTWSQFMYRLATILEMQTVAFIVPVENRFYETVGVTTIFPQSYELIDVEGEAWIRFSFLNGDTAAIEMARVGIMTKYQYIQDYFGDGNEALGDIMALLHIQRQGLEEAAKNANTYRFMAKVSNFTKSSDIANERDRFVENSMQSGSGLLLFPNTYTDIKELTQSAYKVDAAQLEMIRTNVYDYFGVNADVIQNKAVGDVMDAFYNGAIEPFMIQFSEVMTNMLFSWDQQSYGNRIVANANRLQYMTTSAKVEMARELGDRGAIMIDEIRELFNYLPLPDGAGQHAPIRGEYYMVGQEDPDEK